MGQSAAGLVFHEDEIAHGRSGRVALPRVNELAAGASLGAVESARMAREAVEDRRSALDMILQLFLKY